MYLLANAAYFFRAAKIARSLTSRGQVNVRTVYRRHGATTVARPDDRTGVNDDRLQTTLQRAIISQGGRGATNWSFIARPHNAPGPARS